MRSTSVKRDREYDCDPGRVCMHLLSTLFEPSSTLLPALNPARQIRLLVDAH